MGVKSWGVLCLGIHGTRRTGGAGAGTAVSVLEEKRYPWDPVSWGSRGRSREEVPKNLPEAGECAPL